MNLHALFAIAAQRSPEKVALEVDHAGTTVSLTYTELFARAAVKEAGPHVERGFLAYQQAWRESEMARAQSR